MHATLSDNVIPASSRIHAGAEIEGHVVLGENCEIGDRVVIKGDLWLGDDGPRAKRRHSRRPHGDREKYDCAELLPDWQPHDLPATEAIMDMGQS